MTTTDPTHGDLSEEVELLQSLNDRASAEINRLRRELANFQSRNIYYTGDGLAPARVHQGDAGFDLFVHPNPGNRTGKWFIPGHSFIDIDCGISMELPQGVWGMITGRSSTLRKRQLLVATGIIDQGYRGPLYSGVQNLSPNMTVVEPGERLAQLIPFPLVADRIDLVRVDELNDSDRGVNGFGSTGS